LRGCEKIGDCHKRQNISPIFNVRQAAADCPQHFFTAPEPANVFGQRIEVRNVSDPGVRE
jgi:hypothetical protein